MIKQVKYKAFSNDKSVDELHYNTEQWTSELEFVIFELPFLKRLVKYYPYMNSIPNLFENIQSFTKKLDEFENEQPKLIKEIRNHNNQLEGKLECNDLSCDAFYLNEYNQLAENIFNYLQEYKNLKIDIYKFMHGVIANS
ncbi:hypothetical protein EGM88_06035 [Aureibaculum marinum]|uniref:Uncharacterized protein n=1 Tax=Aureibaculum marinum TaxID=2487930 RepID=A0A3N4NVM0_9FLAO|nr:hypothetical protein [Aureibaculum marinum]RPD98747.1 hypothetical protein EGM88_06035 [Aureibaculum marinum]